MRSLNQIVSANDAATLRELRDAIADGNTELALRIIDANPDLPTDAYLTTRRPIQRVQSQSETRVFRAGSGRVYPTLAALIAADESEYIEGAK